ncbi:hypothetical protein CTEN210_04562 [Chaetoceros tenuissimus]|uniref:tRNA-dihydrouridine(16/17) synthase [NAD(P)(+)] n=1 Tax=Chaetoceros tenuissimus TaxID=426638 RepID=A0AAD3CLE2_9STRA|nr:hypothetical protein CTEN210_04562 [Chaetoceros tenuissimus]
MEKDIEASRLEKKRLKKEKKKAAKKEKKKESKKEKKAKKSKRKRDESIENFVKKSKISNDTSIITKDKSPFSFPIKYILAPMVGASELPFRLLCRKYGAQTCYTPMMSSTKFASDPKYRQEEFQTIPEDRPLVCHFSANDPTEFTNAAKLVQDKCDAIDLNLGCPQRTAYLGHFGSYLLEKKDRKLICDIVKMASKNLSIPIFCKIRLLDTIEDTIELCKQLKDAGASLIAIHARYRASFERKGPGARDGPALLDQILKVREALGDNSPKIIANGNVVTYDDVLSNMRFTKADGIMSAEGILDDPALFLPRYGEDEEKCIEIKDPSDLKNTEDMRDPLQKKRRKWLKKLREIEAIEAKVEAGEQMTKEQLEKMKSKDAVKDSLAQLLITVDGDKNQSDKESQPKVSLVKLKDLKISASDATNLAQEYLDLAEKYPTKMRTIIFHTRRILKKELTKYQLMEDCIASKSINELREIVTKVSKYILTPSLFTFDREKAMKEKEALERKKREEGKRKAYEARMIRKAKREGKSDLEHYLRIGAQVPSAEEIEMLKKLSKEDQLKRWIENDHSQHCLAFHLDSCKRDRACAFLHADAKGVNTFSESDEVAG